MEKILVTGAGGQLGSELSLALQRKFGLQQVILTDIKPLGEELSQGIVECVDVMDPIQLKTCIQKHNISQIYHLAAILSAVGEQHPKKAWDVNMQSLLNVLDAAQNLKVKKVFWPSSIAVFGPDSPKENAPQNAFVNPNTIYGISKLAGERWCEYYYLKHNIDVRSLRYPGLIGYKSLPGGGTTDYAVEIYHKAVKGERFTCFLEKDTILPMMYIPEAIKATLQLMEAPAQHISVRSSYNIAGISISPEDITQSIQKYIPDFRIQYHPDFRQEIANAWPKSIDDQKAREDWNWQSTTTLDDMTAEMLRNLKQQLNKS